MMEPRKGSLNSPPDEATRDSLMSRDDGEDEIIEQLEISPTSGSMRTKAVNKDCSSPSVMLMRLGPTMDGPSLTQLTDILMVIDELSMPSDPVIAILARSVSGSRINFSRRPDCSQTPLKCMSGLKNRLVMNLLMSVALVLSMMIIESLWLTSYENSEAVDRVDDDVDASSMAYEEGLLAESMINCP